MKKCVVCRTELALPLLSYRNMPAAAQNMPVAAGISTEKGIDFGVCQCPCCKTVQLDCDAVHYYRDVIRAGGLSSTMVELRRTQYRQLIDTFGLAGAKIVEIGAGSGEFLNVLTEFPVEAYGVENNPESVRNAVAQGLSVMQGYVEDGETVVENGPFDAFLSFNFLEHQPDPNGMLQGIRNNLRDGGAGLITVPSFEYILENDAFYEFIRDHLIYFTEGSLRFLLDRNGFEVPQIGRVNRDTICAHAVRRPRLALEGLVATYTELRTEINSYVDGYIKRGKRVAIWGASHQAFTIIATTEIGDKLSYIVDSAPFKQGKYSPATHVPIVSPDVISSSPVDAIIIAAPGYAAEITDAIRTRYPSHIDIAILRSRKLELLAG
jgi:SAM-dependent methyltransferase